MAEIVNDSNLEAVSGGASANDMYYTVKSGDNLTRIANMYGTNWRTLFALNEKLIVDTAKAHGVVVKKYDEYANHIYAGMVLRVR